MTIQKEFNVSTGEYTTTNLTQQEIDELNVRSNARLPDEVRQTRDGLLKKSDWSQIADAPVDAEAWAAYRQALRNVPDQSGFPNEVTWPTEPEV